jgi:UDP:flavonoid glycosyltransferase YjiC (YdhE family)
MTINQDMTVLNIGGPPNGASKLPLLVFAAAPVTGHISPTLYTAREMIRRGYQIVFMTSPEFKDAVESIGAEYYETSVFFPPGSLEAREKFPPGPPKLVFDMETCFLGAIPTRSANLKSLLEMVREREPHRQVIVITETAAMAVQPFKYGAPLPKGYDKFPKVIGINFIPLMVCSVDTAPFGPGLPPDSTESGRARNVFMQQLMALGPLSSPHELYLKILRDAGCTSSPEGFFLDTFVTTYDCCFQMCTPSLEYPRCDLDPSIRFAGALPKRGVDPNFQYPSWWSKIKDNAALPAASPEKKKLIMVTQGTVAIDYNDIIIPAVKAFAKRNDVLLLVILGVKDASLPADLEIGSNTQVIDYLPYDAGLQYADLFISNGGYGGVLHGVTNGVPMVLAGLTEDKAEVAARGEYAGLAVNLRTQSPSVEALYEGAEKVLSDPKYTMKARRIQQENEDLDSLRIIEKQIKTYTEA